MEEEVVVDMILGTQKIQLDDEINKLVVQEIIDYTIMLSGVFVE